MSPSTPTPLFSTILGSSGSNNNDNASLQTLSICDGQEKKAGLGQNGIPPRSTSGHSQGQERRRNHIINRWLWKVLSNLVEFEPNTRVVKSALSFSALFFSFCLLRPSTKKTSRHDGFLESAIRYQTGPQTILWHSTA
jgi:hypothetical protein